MVRERKPSYAGIMDPNHIPPTDAVADAPVLGAAEGKIVFAEGWDDPLTVDELDSLLNS